MSKKKKGTKKEVNNTKIAIILISIIAVVMVLVVLFGFVLPGKRYLINTAKYMEWDEETTKNVESAMGTENTEYRFRKYFQQFNVLHEIGHGVLRNNNGVKIHIIDEEQLVNEFAIAYWKHYGTEEDINMLKEIADYAVENINYNHKDLNYIEVGKQNSSFERVNNNFFTFEQYGWFQFSSVKKAIENDKSLEEVLKEMGIKNFKLDEPRVLKYELTKEEDSVKIVQDAYENINSWGVTLPKPFQMFQTDPNLNSSATIVNFFFIFDIVGDNYVNP